MIYNWSVPVVTTNHMEGAILISTIFYPYVAIIPISVALLIRLLRFGNRNIATYGTNMFNMAIMMPYVGIAIYSMMMKISKESEKIRSIAPWIASYIVINLVWLACGFEHAVQLFINSSYLLHTYYFSVLLILFANLLIIGAVKFIVSSSVILYLQKVQSEYLYLPKIYPKFFNCEGIK